MNRFAMMTVLFTNGLLVTAATAADKAASPLATPKEGFWTGVTAIVLFLIVFGLLSTMVWPKIVAGLDERNEKIKGEIAAAEDARHQAKVALDEYEKNLAEARAQAQQMLEETKSQQNELAAQLKAQADAELTEMREKAKADIDAAKKQALNELYSESVNLASVMAGKILQREVSVNDEQRLMDESLAELKTVNS
ncbi:MAG: F0F1 ATP synthase subunit B [Phycisphaerales bacterium]|nr:F0F1 ATP synthase subunit B [Phycisphaerales bacterium]